MPTVFFIADEGREGLEADLVAAGFEIAGSGPIASLMRDALRSGAELIVARDRHPRGALLPALAALREHAPLPVLLFTADGDAETLTAALDAGVDACVVNGYAATRLRPLVQLALLRFAREQRLRDELKLLGERFEERKLVDRAKGILMGAGRVGEDEAFRLLRLGSMRLQRRVGQVSQQVIDAARCAHAINLAGRLRMLSQRVVLQHALARAGLDADAAVRERAAALAAAQSALGELSGLLSASTYGDLLQAAQTDWQAFSTALAPAGALADADAAAERCLQSADRLVAALQAAGYGGEPHVVNVCGRQRMLAQRLAKFALLRSLEPAGFDGRAVAATAADFERALALLQAAPLGDAALRAKLEEGAAAWSALRAAALKLADAGASSVPAAQGHRRSLAVAGESVLAVFDDLTGRYERSLDLLIG